MSSEFRCYKSFVISLELNWALLKRTSEKRKLCSILETTIFKYFEVCLGKWTINRKNVQKWKVGNIHMTWHRLVQFVIWMTKSQTRLQILIHPECSGHSKVLRQQWWSLAMYLYIRTTQYVGHHGILGADLVVPGLKTNWC